MSKPELKDRKQVAAFRKAARELGADDSSEADFQNALRVIAKAKPKDHPRKDSKRKSD